MTRQLTRTEVAGGGQIDRVPPHSKEAEEALLGAMLLSRDSVSEALELVTPEDFYFPEHAQIYKAILGLYLRGAPIDPVTVSDELAKMGVLEQVGGYGALLALQEGTPGISSVEEYASIVEQLAVLRGLIRVSWQIQEICYSRPSDIVAAIDEAERLVFEVAQRRSREALAVLKDLLREQMEQLRAMAERGSSITGLPTGFIDLDQKLGGLQKSNLVIVGARPAMGKTSFALNIATHVAVRERVPVVVFSLEMNKAELTHRILAAQAEVDSQRLRTGHLTEREWAKIGNAMSILSDAPLYIDDSPNLTVMDIRAKARRLAAKVGLGLVVVDYLQLMTSRQRAENRQVEVSEISRGLKILARELTVPVLAISQLSRGLEQRTDKRPILADLRESGSLEQDADVVLFVYRDEVYTSSSEDRGVAEVIIAKHRNGPIGVVRLAFSETYTRFNNLARS
jgi:replicative DNA helicase